MRVVSGNNPDYAGFLIKLLLRSNKEIGTKFESDNAVPRVNSNIVRSIKFFVKNILKAKGYKEKEEKQVMQIILIACTSNLHKDTNKNKVCEFISKEKQHHSQL